MIIDSIRDLGFASEDGSRLESHWASEVAEIPDSLKWSFVTRNVPSSALSSIEILHGRRPEAGDIVCARVSQVGQQTRLQLRGGRRSRLYMGDVTMLAYGNRYAPDQFEAVTPRDLNPCELVASGGIAGRARSKHSRMKNPTRVEPLGFAVDRTGNVLNMRDHWNPAISRAISPSNARISGVPVVAVVGTSMNSGKTTTASALVKGLQRSGLGVAAIKATGTGAGNDLWSYEDAGAVLALDFTDVGHPSTYRLSDEQIEALFARLVISGASREDVDCVVVEIADGLLHPETQRLVESETFRKYANRVLFAAGEAMSAVSGARWFNDHEIRLDGISGLVSASKLAAEETARHCQASVFTKADLESSRALECLNLRSCFANQH